MQDHPYLTAPRLFVWIALLLLVILIITANRRVEHSYHDAVLVHRYIIAESLVG